MTLDRKISTWSLLWLAAVGAMFLMFWRLPPAHGQGPVACADVIQELNKVMRKCDNLNNNYACYGRKRAEALPFGEPFERTGDRIPLAAAEKIETLSETGTVIMRVSTGGQDPVTLITFGDTEIEPSGEPAATNSFVARTVNNEFVCEQTPPGLIVYTESGQSGVVDINGIGITLHSAAYVILDNPDSMRVINLNGRVQVSANGLARDVPLGYEIAIQGVLTSATFVDPAAPSEFDQSAVARWLVDEPAGLDSVHSFEETILSCSYDDISLPFNAELRLYSPGQECLIEFCTSPGDRITVRLEALDARLDPWVDLRGPDLRLLYHNNNISQLERNALLCNEPLLAQGCYTVVAHSRYHESMGAFRLSVQGQTACEQPPSICEVTYYAGINLRAGPEEDAAFVRALLPGTEVEPLALSASGTRLKVRVLNTGEQGWVLNSAEALSCSGPLPTPVTATPTSFSQTPTPTQTSTPKGKTPTPTPPAPTPPRAVPQPGPTKQSPYG